MATITRPTAGYTPTNPITNATKYQDDSAATSPRVAISSEKVDGDLNKAFDTLTDHDNQLDNHEGRINVVEAAITAPPEFSDNVFRIKGSVDVTKKLAFEVDGLTTGTTRTITPLDENMILVGTTNTQTLSNKTFTQTLAVDGTSSGPATITLAEDTDNGTNKVTLTAPASLASDVTSTLPDVTGTLANRSKFASITYEVAAGGVGGAATADAWTTRPMNTETDPDNIISLSANQFQVAKTGTYKLSGAMQVFAEIGEVNLAKARIYNVTDGALVAPFLTGGVSFPSGTSGNITLIMPERSVTLTSGKNYALQYYVDAVSGDTRELGYAYGNAASGTAEVFAHISIEYLT